MTNPNIDYTSTNFEYSSLTKIQGIPTYEPLRKIKNEMKANAASVPCDLGGGNNGHLGLILSIPEYANVSLTPYCRPLHPGILNIPVGTPNYEATRLTSEHKELIRLNREANNIEASLLKQLGHALPDLYLKSFRNQFSNTFTSDIPTILHYLFTTYGYITPEELKGQEETLCSKVFDIQQPLIILFDELKKLQQISVAALNPYTGTQMVNIGLKLIKNFNDFEKGLISWFERPVGEHTLINLKTHFEREYQALRRVRGTTMRNSAYFQQANALSSVMKQFEEERALILAEVKDSEYKILQAMQVSDNNSSSDDRDDDNTPRHSNQSANSASSDAIQLEILKLLREMRDDNNNNHRGANKRNRSNRSNNNNNNSNNNQSNNNNLRGNNNSNTNNGNNRNNNNNANNPSTNNNNRNNNNATNNGQNQNNRHNNRNRNTSNTSSSNNNNTNGTNGRTRNVRYDTSKYCSSCGAWNHNSKDCFRKGPNHNDNATFENKMGGSTYYCESASE